MVYERVCKTSLANYQILGDELHFKGGKVAPNRFLKAAMTEMLCTWHDTDLSQRGIPTQSIINMYEKWGNGGFGIILTGNVHVDPKHPEAVGNPIISKENYSEELLHQYKKWAKVSKTDGALAVVQLSHAGRQTPVSINATPLAPSVVHLTVMVRNTMFGVPIALTAKQIQTEVIDRFVFAAKFAFEAGFDGVQLHSAHGYLLSQFLSPTTNKRTDKYGGSLENRARIILEIYHRIRAELGEVGKDFLIGTKTNSVEFQKDGIQPEEAKILCQMFVDAGFDFVELSGGNYESLAFQHKRESTKAREAFFLEFTDKIRPVFANSYTKVYVTGGFRTVAGMVGAIEGISTDGIGLGRPIAHEPDLPKKILSGLCWSTPDSKFNQQNFALTMFGCNSQMYQMGLNSVEETGGNICHGIADFSHPKEAENYQNMHAPFMKLMEERALAGLNVDGVMKYKNVVKDFKLE